jgi:hypothetical protein
MLWYADAFQCAAMPLRTNDTSGLVSASLVVLPLPLIPATIVSLDIR